jgi:hypothetical protein
MTLRAEVRVAGGGPTRERQLPETTVGVADRKDW